MNSNLTLKNTQVLNKSDIQMLDLMIYEIKQGKDDPVKNKKILDVYKMKLASAREGVKGLREMNTSDKNEIDRERVALDRARFEYKMRQDSHRIIENNEIKEVSEPTTAYWDDICTVKHHLTDYLQTKPGNQNIMPIHEELEEAGLEPLVNAIIKHGGFKEVARKCALIWMDEHSGQ